MKKLNFLKHSLLFLLPAFVCTVILTSAGSVSANDALIKIADNVFSYVDIQGSSSLNSFGANAGIIIGKDEIIVIDTLISSKEAERFIKDIRELSDKPIKYVVNTHYHLDHAFGNSEFEKIGAIIISHAAGKKNLQDNGETALKNIGSYGLTETDMEGTKITLPDVTFTDRMEIDLTNEKIELIYPGVSHTEGSIMVYIPDKKILFAGDILFTDYHPFIAEGDIMSWIKALDYILTMDVEKIIPGHGPVSGKKDVEDMKDYLITFDKVAKELSGKSDDVEYIFSEIKKVLPQRPEGEFLIKSNIQMKYLKK